LNVSVEVGDGGSVAVSGKVSVTDGGTVAVFSGVADGNTWIVAVFAVVEVGEGGMVAVEVAVFWGIGVLLGTQPPCIELPEISPVLVSEVMPAREFACINEAFTALNDRQVNGISRPIKSASSASRISVVRFLFLSSMPTSSSQSLKTPVIELIQHSYCKYCAD
jgi:hypothetical protein